MPRPGGPADKLGNHYEAVWTVEAMLDVFEGKYRSITVEAFDDESLGVEFHLTTLDSRLQFHCVKRQKQGGDWSIADLCRSQASTDRSILQDLAIKLQTYPDCELCFVSATGANRLRELTERAKETSTLSEFELMLQSAVDLGKAFESVVSVCQNSREAGFQFLKATEVRLQDHRGLVKNVERRIEGLLYRKDGSELEADDIRRQLTEFVLENLGRAIASVTISEYLHTQGLGKRDWKSEPAVIDAIQKANSRYLKVVEIELINSAHMPRKVVVEQILATITTPNVFGSLLIGAGGYGKSCVLAQVLSIVQEHTIPTLCLRMDSLEPCNTSKQLGKQLDLPASPATVLAGVADNKPSVLIIDQLDAMSLVSGRHPKMWEVFSELIDEVRSYPNMKMVVACRDFDLDHDQRLRSLQNSDSGFNKVSLSRLDNSEIDAALTAAGITKSKLTSSQYQILSIPFHLLLYLEGNPAETFTSVAQLYDKYWDRKRRKVRERLGESPHWIEVIDALCAKMSRDQVLFAPKAVVDEWDDDVRAMISEHVLVKVDERDQVRFFHESFFDYAFARRFCVSDQRLVDFLTSSEQHLFRRAQVRQILTYQREHDFQTYLLNLREVLALPDIRFHVKRMVVSGLHQIDKPTRQEWSIVEPLLNGNELSPFCWGTIRNHAGWFDLLVELGVIQKWLTADDIKEVNNAAWHLASHSLQDDRSPQIAELIRPYLGRSEEWNKRIVSILTWGNAHKSPEMSTIQLELVRKGAYNLESDEENTGRDFWHQFHNAVEENPRFLIDIAVAWFDHAIEAYNDGSSWNFLDKVPLNRSHYGAQLLGQAAAAEPVYFLEQFMQRLIDTVLRTEERRGNIILNRVWPRISNHGDPFSVDDAILLATRRSLQSLALNAPAVFRDYANQFKDYRHQTFAYLLLTAFRENPQFFADECADYLLEDESRFYVGYGSWSGGGEGTGESAVSRKALLAISPVCSLELLRRMESTIIGNTDEWEKENPRWRGSGELLVLRALDKTRLASKTLLRIEELERKFPDLSDAIVPENNSSLLRCVGPPLSPQIAELMTDEQWIAAMQKYDGTTDRLSGGPIELSRMLSGFARKDRERFANLVQKMPETVDPMYFSAVLDGICSRYLNLSADEKGDDKKDLDETSTKLFLGVIDRLHDLPNKPCGSAIVGCLELLGERDIPEPYLEIISYYATSDPDPKADIWKESPNGTKYYGGNPYDHGINCVRGQAARSISLLLYDDNSRFESLLPTLRSLAIDPVVSVRTCAITAFLPVLNFAPDIAVELFCQACRDSEDICGTHPFDRFVHYSVAAHYSQLKELLQFALQSDNTEAVQNAARQIILADLDQEGIELAESVRSGNSIMRQAAASVYAHNLSHAEVGDKCAEHLLRFLDDEDGEVRGEVAGAFFNMSGERILKRNEFIAKFIESKSFEADAYRLLHSLEESNVELPNIVCRAAERVLQFIGVEGTSVAYHGSMAANSIATLVVRLYEQSTDIEVKKRCLDLIDEMERRAYYGVSEELGKLDR